MLKFETRGTAIKVSKLEQRGTVIEVSKLELLGTLLEMEKLTYKIRLTFGIGDVNIIKDRAKQCKKQSQKTFEKNFKIFKKRY